LAEKRRVAAAEVEKDRRLAEEANRVVVQHRALDMQEAMQRQSQRAKYVSDLRRQIDEQKSTRASLDVMNDRELALNHADIQNYKQKNPVLQSRIPGVHNIGEGGVKSDRVRRTGMFSSKSTDALYGSIFSQNAKSILQ
jgi:hypothetical protein